MHGYLFQTMDRLKRFLDHNGIKYSERQFETEAGIESLGKNPFVCHYRIINYKNLSIGVHTTMHSHNYYYHVYIYIYIQDPEARIFVLAMYQSRALPLMCKVGIPIIIIIITLNFVG